jgi:hypothetical protein
MKRLANTILPSVALSALFFGAMPAAARDGTMYGAVASAASHPYRAAGYLQNSFTIEGDTGASHDVESFSVGPVSGTVRYQPVYHVGRPQDVALTLASVTPMRFACLGYRDFDFELKSAAGMQIAPTGKGQALTTVQAYVPPQGVWMGPGRQPCPYQANLGGKWILSLGARYPQLQPGSYALTISVAPEDATLMPAARLATISFKVQSPDN